MKINSIILNVLFIIILICLIYFFIYLNNSNFENFDDVIVNPQASTTDTRNIITTQVESTNTGIVSSEFIPEVQETIYNGRLYNTPLNSADFGFVLAKVASNTDGTSFIPDYKDGYYWINIRNVGTKFIYCIMDEDYWGGGWMLAMRAVYGSKNFSYDSEHFKSATTLNASSSYIENIIPEAWRTDINSTELRKSSIGDKIYDTSNIDPNVYDAKYDTFNYSKSVEWMAIFYVKNPTNNQKIIGGDLLAPKNKRGWIWREKNVQIKEMINNEQKDKAISPLELFNYLDNPRNQENDRDLTRKYNQYGFAQNIGGKFINARGNTNTFNNQIFSSQPVGDDKRSYYGINNHSHQDLSYIRWGFNFNDNITDATNDAFGGIGTSYKTQDSREGTTNPNEKGFSAGNFEMQGKDSLGRVIDDGKFFDRPIHNTLRNRSYAVEWYVREKSYCV
jgi:hypothetical protein